MSDDGHCTCPQARRTKTRRHKKDKVYQSKEWKEKVKAFIAGKSCEWCGSTEKLLAHHPYRDTPDAIYEDLHLSGCIALCNTCHFMFHRRHKKKCPICRENWMDLDVDRCYICHLNAHPELVSTIAHRAEVRERDRKARMKVAADKRRALKSKHPCKSHKIGGACALSPINSQCPYARTKALRDCNQAVAKKKMVKS
jgi:hypothetical protein